MPNTFERKFKFKVKFKFKYKFKFKEGKTPLLLEAVDDKLSIYDFKFKYKYKQHILTTTVQKANNVYDFKFKYKYKQHNLIQPTPFELHVYDFKFKYKYKQHEPKYQSSPTTSTTPTTTTQSPTFAVYDFKFKYKYKQYQTYDNITTSSTTTSTTATQSPTFAVYDFKFKYKYKQYQTVDNITTSITTTSTTATQSPTFAVYDFKFKYKYKQYSIDNVSLNVYDFKFKFKYKQHFIDLNVLNVYDFKFKYKYKYHDLGRHGINVYDFKFKYKYKAFYDDPFIPFVCSSHENNFDANIVSTYLYQNVTFQKTWYGNAILANTFYVSKSNGVQFDFGAWGSNGLKLSNLYIFDNTKCVGENNPNALIQDLSTIQYTQNSQPAIFNPSKDSGVADIYLATSQNAYTEGNNASSYITVDNRDLSNVDISGLFIVKPTTSYTQVNIDGSTTPYHSNYSFKSSVTMIRINIRIPQINIHFQAENNLNPFQFNYPEVNLTFRATNIPPLYTQIDINTIDTNLTFKNYLYVYSILWFENETDTEGIEMLCEGEQILINDTQRTLENTKPGGYTIFNHKYKYQLSVKNSIFGNTYIVQNTITTLPPIPNIRGTMNGMIWYFKENTDNIDQLSFVVKRGSFTVKSYDNTESINIQSTIYDSISTTTLLNSDHENLIPSKPFVFTVQSKINQYSSNFSEEAIITFTNFVQSEKVNFSLIASRNPTLGSLIQTVDSFGNILESEDQFIEIHITNTPSINTANLEYHIFDKFKLIEKLSYINTPTLYLSKRFDENLNKVDISPETKLFINVALFDTQTNKYYNVGDTLYIRALTRPPAPITGAPDLLAIPGQNEIILNWSVTNVQHKEFITYYKIYLLKFQEAFDSQQTLSITDNQKLLNTYNSEVTRINSSTQTSYTHNTTRTLQDNTIYAYRIVAFNRDDAYINILQDISNSIVQAKTLQPIPAFINSINSTAHIHEINFNWTLINPYSNDDKIFYKPELFYTTNNGESMDIHTGNNYITNKSITTNNLLCDTSFNFVLESFTNMSIYNGNATAPTDYSDTSGNIKSIHVKTQQFNPNYINNFNSVLLSTVNNGNITWYLDICSNYLPTPEWRKWSVNPKEPTIFYIDSSNSFDNGDIIAIFDGNSPYICLDIRIWNNETENSLVCSKTIEGATSNVGMSNALPYFQVYRQATQTIHPLSVSEINKYDNTNSIISSFNKVITVISGGPLEASYKDVVFTYAKKVFNLYENGIKINTFIRHNTNNIEYTETISINLNYDYAITFSVQDPVTTSYSKSYSRTTRGFSMLNIDSNLSISHTIKRSFQVDLTEKYKTQLQTETQSITLQNNAWNLMSFYVRHETKHTLNSLFDLSGSGISGYLYIFNESYIPRYEYNIDTNTWNDDETITYDNGYYVMWYNPTKSPTDTINIQVPGNTFEYVYMELTQGYNFFSWPFTYNQTLYKLLEEYIIVNNVYDYTKRLVDFVQIIISADGTFITKNQIQGANDITLAQTQAYIINVNQDLLIKMENIYETFNIDIIDNNYNPEYLKAAGHRLLTIDNILTPDVILVKAKPYVFTLSSAVVLSDFEIFHTISGETVLNSTNYEIYGNKVLIRIPYESNLVNLYYGTTTVQYAGGDKPNNIYIISEEEYRSILLKSHDYIELDKDSDTYIENQLFNNYKRNLYFRDTPNTSSYELIQLSDLGYGYRANQTQFLSKQLLAIIRKNADNNYVESTIIDNLYFTTIYLYKLRLANILQETDHAIYFHLENVGDRVKIYISETIAITIIKFSATNAPIQYKLLFNDNTIFVQNSETNSVYYNDDDIFEIEDEEGNIYSFVLGSISVSTELADDDIVICEYGFVQAHLKRISKQKRKVRNTIRKLYTSQDFKQSIRLLDTNIENWNDKIQSYCDTSGSLPEYNKLQITNEPIPNWEIQNKPHLHDSNTIESIPNETIVPDRWMNKVDNEPVKNHEKISKNNDNYRWVNRVNNSPKSNSNKNQYNRKKTTNSNKQITKWS